MGAERRRSGPPIFTDDAGTRWSIGSPVLVMWWGRETPDAPLSPVVEHEALGRVCGLVRSSECPDGWRVVVDLGIAVTADLDPPTTFGVDQVRHA